MRALLLGVIGVGICTSHAVAEEAPAEPAASASDEAHGFGIGARTEFLNEGVSSLTAAYDFGGLEIEASAGFVIRENDADNPSDLYNLVVLAAFTVHRSGNAELAVGGGAGLGLQVVPDADDDLAVSLSAGARIRIFTAPNFALQAAVGVTALIRDGGSIVAFGARPLGSVGFIYYFGGG